MQQFISPKKWAVPYWSYKLLKGICLQLPSLFTQAWNKPSQLRWILKMAYTMCNLYHQSMYESCITNVPQFLHHTADKSVFLHPRTVWGTAEWWTIRSFKLQSPSVLLLRWSLLYLNPKGRFSYLKTNAADGICFQQTPVSGTLKNKFAGRFSTIITSHNSLRLFFHYLHVCTDRMFTYSKVMQFRSPPNMTKPSFTYRRSFLSWAITTLLF